MRNSRWRPFRNYNQEEHRKACPRWNNPPPLPHPSRVEPNSVPSWEMQFCSVIGLVPWWKVVNAKQYNSCYKNILEWDDSASEEAFHNAKQRFWAQINGLPCEISLPGPNIYIDNNINYEPYIDPELVLDLEREYVAIDDEEEVNERTPKNRKITYSNTLSEYFSQENDKNLGNCENPWESNDTSQNCENPWEQGHVKNKACEDIRNNWACDNNASCRKESKGWGDFKNESKYLENKQDNAGWGTWEANCGKIEDLHQYISKNKNVSFKGDDPRRGHLRFRGGNYSRKRRYNS